MFQVYKLIENFLQGEFPIKMCKLFGKINIRVVKQRFFNIHMNSYFLSSKRWLLYCYCLICFLRNYAFA